MERLLRNPRTLLALIGGYLLWQVVLRLLIGGGLELDEGEQLILDGHYGVVFADPEDSMLRHYLRKQSESDRYRRVIETLRERPARSLDGVDIRLMANAERPDDIRKCEETD